MNIEDNQNLPKIGSKAYLKLLLTWYRGKRRVDRLNGRPWDAVAHWNCEQKIRMLEDEPLMKESKP